jgi:hypothetical protein
MSKNFTRTLEEIIGRASTTKHSSAQTKVGIVERPGSALSAGLRCV